MTLTEVADSRRDAHGIGGAAIVFGSSVSALLVAAMLAVTPGAGETYEINHAASSVTVAVA